MRFVSVYETYLLEINVSCDFIMSSLRFNAKLPHIQMMRAMAISLIICFHLSPDVCPGGYLGVDMFLVISGYFIFGKEWKNENFSFSDYLLHKAKRILPPVLFVILLIEISSILFLPSVDLLKAAELFPSSLLGYTNLSLDAQSSQYFSGRSRFFPTMHLWYIAVYLQSLIVLSCVFVCWRIFRFHAKWRLLSIALIGGLSVLICRHNIPLFDGSPYYWTSARIWEICLGGGIAIAPENPYFRKHPGWTAIVIALSAAAFISLAFNPFCAGGSFRYLALSAALSAVFIYVGKSADSLRCLFNFSLIQYVGAISFSLYLVHWPFISITEYVTGSPLFLHEALLLLLPITVVSIAVYFLIEHRKCGMKPTLCFGLASWGLFSAICVSDGFAALLHTEANSIVSPSEQFEGVSKSSALYEGTENIIPNQFTTKKTLPLLLQAGDANKKPNFVILGDSHALNFAEGMNVLGKERGWCGVYLHSYVVPFWGICYGEKNSRGLYFNADKAKTVMTWLQNKPELHYVFLVQSWGQRYTEQHPYWDGTRMSAGTDEVREAHRKGLVEMCRQLQSIGKTVILVTDQPRLRQEISPPRVLRAKAMYSLISEPISSLTVTLKEYQQFNRSFLEDVDYIESLGLCRSLHRELFYFAHGNFCAYEGKKCKMYDNNHCNLIGTLEGLRGAGEQLEAWLLSEK